MQPDRQTDGWMLPNALSFCYTVDNKSLLILDVWKGIGMDFLVIFSRGPISLIVMIKYNIDKLGLCNSIAYTSPISVHSDRNYETRRTGVADPILLSENTRSLHRE